MAVTRCRMPLSEGTSKASTSVAGTGSRASPSKATCDERNGSGTTTLRGDDAGTAAAPLVALALRITIGAIFERFVTNARVMVTPTAIPTTAAAMDHHGTRCVRSHPTLAR